jgi:hypothetical protein
MLLTVKDRGRTYEVQAPSGTEAYQTGEGRPGLVIPGERAGDTAMLLPMEAVLACAGRRLYGLKLRSEAAAGSTHPLTGRPRCS